MRSVCIVIATKNSERTIDRCLSSIFQQGYPKKLLEVILVDGGSSDRTLSISKKFPVRIIVRRDVDSEEAKAVGLKASKADIYCDMAADNYLPNKHFISDLVEPINGGKAVSSYPERYYYDKDDSLLNRYFALVGVNDPLAFYLGKADRKSYLNSKYQVPPRLRPSAGSGLRSGPRFGSAIFNKISRTNYQIVEFNNENMPTLGANGFFIERKLLLKADIKNFFHIDVVWDLLQKGRLRFAVVKTAIGHDTGENLLSFLSKRRRYFENLYLKNIKKRRYHLYDNKKDFWKLLKFIVYSVTFVEPMFLSIRGYLRVRDRAWFLHPVICFLTVINYGFVVVKTWFR